MDFSSIINSTANSLSVSDGVICMALSFVMGAIISVVYMTSGKYTKSFAISLFLLPVLVQAVIMMTSGNIGVGVAVLGTFSLVRYRSIPGTSREITAVFFAVAVGIAMGVGAITYAAFITLCVGVVLVILNKTKFGEGKASERMLKITIPEDIDYTEVFDDIFKKYTNKVTLERVRTTNMGSLFELTYRIEVSNNINEKEFIDDIRCRNGNLTVICSRQTNVDMLEL